jgi:hypothetical protein
MGLILAIDFVVVAGLIGITVTRGLERALPFFVFVTLFFPDNSAILLPGVFNLTTRRLAIIVLVVLFLLFRQRNTQAQILSKTPLRVLLALQIGWCLVSTLNSIVPVDSIKKMCYEVVEYYLMYFIIVWTVTQVKTVHRIMGAMVAAVFVACIFGWIEAYSDWRLVSLFPYSAGRFTGWEGMGADDRFYSTFDNYSLFGAAISFVIIQAFYLLTTAKTRGRKIYLWAALIVMFLNIYKLVTRGPWLALIMGFAIFFFVGGAATRKRMLVILALVVLVLAARPGVRDTIWNLYLDTVDTSNPGNVKGQSYEYRYALWHVSTGAVERSLSHELWGYGLESFFYLHLRAPFGTNPEYPFASCDSSWAELMVETGFVGLGLIGLLLLTPALIMIRDMRRIPKPERAFLGVLLINMLQYYFMMTNVAIYSWGQTAYMLWMWIALGMVYRSAIVKQEAQNQAKAPVLRPATHFELAPVPGA